jgi:hypothetical protein
MGDARDNPDDSEMMMQAAARSAALLAAAALLAGLAGCNKAKEGEAKPAAPAAATAPAAPPTALGEGLSEALLGSDGSHNAKYTSPDEIFAHAPTTLHAVLFEPLHLRGVAGIKPPMAGQPVCGDGVEYVISKLQPTGEATVLFTTKIAPKGAEVPFDVTLAKGDTLQMETRPGGTTDCDWAYWGQLQKAAP